MTVEQIITKAANIGLPIAYTEFRKTKTTPLPEPPYLIWLVIKEEDYGGDNSPNLLRRTEMAIELYTDRQPNKELERKIELEVLHDIGFTKWQEMIDSEDMHQTAYNFTVLEKLRKGIKKHE